MDAETFFIQEGPLCVLPILHYTLESSIYVRKALLACRPDCIAVELPSQLQPYFLQAAARLPDVTLVIAHPPTSDKPHYWLVEPVDPLFEALRSALEMNIPLFCIDAAVEDYPDTCEALPDAYAIHRLGTQKYMQLLEEKPPFVAPHPQDEEREWTMAQKLKELSFSFEKICFVSGAFHAARVVEKFKQASFPALSSFSYESAALATLAEKSARQAMMTCGYLCLKYEEARARLPSPLPPDTLDRAWLFSVLLKKSAQAYEALTQTPVSALQWRTFWRFAAKYAHLRQKLIPDLYQLIIAAKGCIDNEFAYILWQLATEYPYLQNADALPQLDIDPQSIWGKSRRLRFQFKDRTEKALPFPRRQHVPPSLLRAPSPFAICSYPPEDIQVEQFGKLAKRKSQQILADARQKSQLFAGSFEEGIDLKQSLRQLLSQSASTRTSLDFSLPLSRWLEVKKEPPLPGATGAVVVIFDDENFQNALFPFKPQEVAEKYPWQLCWLGEHEGEADMAFYATPYLQQIVGPGICRCYYGGFMLSYPPRRLLDIWSDPDYLWLPRKSEVLLLASIHYCIGDTITYVASRPPRPLMRKLAQRFGKKIQFVPLGQFCRKKLRRLRLFHVLDSHQRREIADEYIL